MAFPGLVIVIVLLTLLGPGLGSVILALGLSLSFPQSRTIRGATLVVREHAFVEASRAAGASHLRIAAPPRAPEHLGVRHHRRQQRRSASSSSSRRR